MGFLLKLATGNPLVLLWAALGILAFGLASGFAGGWTLNGWRLGTKLATCQGDLKVAGNDLRLQNAAVEEWQAKAAQARQAGAQAQKQARSVAESHSALVSAWKGRIEAQTPVSVAGVTLGCREGLAEVRAGK